MVGDGNTSWRCYGDSGWGELKRDICVAEKPPVIAPDFCPNRKQPKPLDKRLPCASMPKRYSKNKDGRIVNQPKPVAEGKPLITDGRGVLTAFYKKNGVNFFSEDLEKSLNKLIDECIASQRDADLLILEAREKWLAGEEAKTLKAILNKEADWLEKVVLPRFVATSGQWFEVEKHIASLRQPSAEGRGRTTSPVPPEMLHKHRAPFPEEKENAG